MVLSPWAGSEDVAFWSHSLLAHGCATSPWAINVQLIVQLINQLIN